MSMCLLRLSIVTCAYTFEKSVNLSFSLLDTHCSRASSVFYRRSFGQPGRILLLVQQANPITLL